MKDFVFITGNQRKVEYLTMWLGRPVEHHAVDLEELQSLDLEKVVAHKAKSAYEIVHRPVLVEDISLAFTAMGRLPGTLVKWFLHEIGNEGLVKIADGLEHRKAEARVMYGYYDGQTVRTFDGRVSGTIAPAPRQNDNARWSGPKSWYPIFIPDGATKTYAEMTDNEVKQSNHRAKAIDKLKPFLEEA